MIVAGSERTPALSSSKRSVKCRISANCLASACSRSRCCVGSTYVSLVRARSRLCSAASVCGREGEGGMEGWGKEMNTIKVKIRLEHLI